MKEGFGLSVTESLWKETPVVASNVGGISLQIVNGVNGYFVDSPETLAKALMKLLEDPKKAKAMGKKGKEMVREKFLITRQVRDYVNLLKKHVIHYKPA